MTPIPPPLVADLARATKRLDAALAAVRTLPTLQHLREELDAAQAEVDAAKALLDAARPPA